METRPSSVHPGARELVVQDKSLVFAVEAVDAGPRVALGGHAANFDVLVHCLAAIVRQANLQHGFDPAALLGVPSGAQHAVPAAARRHSPRCRPAASSSLGRSGERLL